MSELLRTQMLLASLVPRLIDHAIDTMGCQVTLWECARSDEQAVIHALGGHGRSALAGYLEADVRWHALAVAIANNGSANGILLSRHRERGAIDMGLYRAGLYLSDVEDYRPLGNFWKTLSPECAWGGDFKTPDAVHFSIAYQGRS